MTSQLHTAKANDSLLKAEQIFEKHHLRHLPVVKGKHLVDIMSKTDLLKMKFADKFEAEDASVDLAIFDMLQVGHVMHEKVVTIQPDQKIVEAAQILTTEDFNALPVVENNELVGIVTSTDIMRYLLKIMS
jgi:CBS domain-containing membrane protein